MIVRARDFKLDLSSRTFIMGIVNLTPDSFSNDGLLDKSHDPRAHVQYAQKLIQAGADIIDFGAESSRPGANRISTAEEIKRLIPTLKAFIPKANIPVSIDSYKVDVIHAALDAGASIINTIQGLKISKKILKLVMKYDAAIVLMHMRGTPITMQKKIQYKDLIRDIKKDLSIRVDFCLDFGLKKDRIIIDPGIGFAKQGDQNFQIIRHLSSIRTHGLPILLGTSRKSFLGYGLGDMAKDRLAATAASVSAGILNGANIIRAHDVAFMKDVATITDKIKHI